MDRIERPKEMVREVKHISGMPPDRRGLLTFSVSVITVTGRHRTIYVRGKDEMDVYRRILLEGI